MPDNIRACLGRRMALLRPNTSVVNPRFLLYYYLSPPFQRLIKTRSIHGATVSRIPLNRMSQWPVDLPRLGSQEAIAAVLGALDDKITANTALARTADELIGALYARAMAASHTERIPFLALCEVTFGEPFQGSSFSAPGVGRPLIRIRDIKAGSCQVWTTESRARETIVQPGELLVGMDAEFRPRPWLGAPALLNQRVCKIHSPDLGPGLLRHAITACLAEIEGSKSGTTVIHLNKSDLQRSEIKAPTRSTLLRLEKQTGPLHRTLVQAAAENLCLVELRDTLLPALMSGRLRVKDAEHQVEDAV